MPSTSILQLYRREICLSGACRNVGETPLQRHMHVVKLTQTELLRIRLRPTVYLRMFLK